MKRIYFARHAKSSWEHPELSDAMRPLIDTGWKRTEKVIKYLREQKVKPEVFISSHAVRAHETAKLLAAGLDFPPGNIKIDKRLYFNGSNEFFDVVYELPDNVSSVILVSHNPDITNISNHFLHERIDYLPTSGVIGFVFDTGKWTEIDLVERKLEIMAIPKLL